MNHHVCIHILLLPTYCCSGDVIIGIGLLFRAYYYAGGLIAGTGRQLQLISKLGSRCWDRFAIYSFAKLSVRAGTRTNLAAAGRITPWKHGGIGWARPQTFLNTFCG